MQNFSKTQHIIQHFENNYEGIKFGRNRKSFALNDFILYYSTEYKNSDVLKNGVKQFRHDKIEVKKFNYVKLRVNKFIYVKIGVNVFKYVKIGVN